MENFEMMMMKGIEVTPRILLYMIPVFAFIVIASSIDQKYMKIPNKLNYTMMLLRLSFAMFYPIEGTHILGFIIGGALILIPAMIVLKPMGGDIKFCAALGFWIGDIKILFTLVVAVIMFVVYGVFIKKLDKRESAAFAPFMSLGCVVVLLIGLFLHYQVLA